MEIIGLIVLSCVLMLFNGGIVGVIMLWAYAFYRWYQKQKNIAKRNAYREKFKKEHGYYPPGV